MPKAAQSTRPPLNACEESCRLRAAEVWLRWELLRSSLPYQRLAVRSAQDQEGPSGSAQHSTFFLLGSAGSAEPRAAGFVSRFELRPAFAARPVPGLEALLGPRFYVNAGGVDAPLAPVQPLGGLFSSASERREAERQTSWCAARPLCLYCLLRRAEAGTG